ncbi:MAG TPA: response regulator transcription factor [Syntrophorhabdaceae bacterium]|jgi:DNA-binding NarL/FixJ family response regulator
MIRVFLADDHPIVRTGVQLMLDGQADMNVIGVAGNGRAAVREVMKLRPDVAVMDITMPELNGIDATEQICEKNPSTRVIILSMHSDMPHVFRALRAGASGYVMKESEAEELISAVRAVHNGGRHLSEPIAEKLIDDYILHYRYIEQGDPLSKLSSREKEILLYVVQGKTSKEIGSALGLSKKTVNTYRYRVMEKLSITDIPGLVRFGMQNGLTPENIPYQP